MLVDPRNLLEILLWKEDQTTSGQLEFATWTQAQSLKNPEKCLHIMHLRKLQLRILRIDGIFFILFDLGVS